MNKTKVEKKAGRGRPSNVKKEILRNSLHFQNRTDKEMVTLLLEKTDIRSKMKPASDEIIQRNLYVSVRKAREESVAKGKKVEFRGRVKDGKLVKKWLHTKVKTVVAAVD